MRDLSERAGTAVIFVIVLTAGIVIHPIGCAMLFGIISVIGQSELNRGKRQWLMGVNLALYGGLVLAGMYDFQILLFANATLLGMLIYTALLSFSKRKFIWDPKKTPLGGLFYLPLACASFAVIRFNNFENPEGLFLGFEWAFGIILLIWANDTGAYFVGSKLGRKKLMPHISPGKSIEGFYGGIASSLLVGWAISELFDYSAYLNVWLALAIVVSILGPIGDLLESAWKRRLEIKDSGSFMPGHGGVLDRFDAVFMVTPAAFILLFTWVFN